jgi:hypothetical protein
MQFNHVALNESDLQLWADFSNDRNPIHFDLSVAKRLNFENIVAHGKLALLPLKAKVSLMASQKNNWYLFKAIFRSPVVCQQALTINVTEKQQRTTFSLNDAVTEKSYIKGSLSNSEPTSVRNIILSGCIANNELKNSLNKFTLAFPDYLRDWIVIDSVMFSHIVDLHFSNIINQYSDTKNIDIKSHIRSNESQNLVVQTSQTTIFKSTLLEQKLCQGTLTNSKFTYDIGNIESYRDNGKCICSMDISINIDNENIMITSYGFILI